MRYYLFAIFLSFLIVPSLATAEDVVLTGENTSNITVRNVGEQPDVFFDPNFDNLPLITVEVAGDEICNITLDENASLKVADIKIMSPISENILMLVFPAITSTVDYINLTLKKNSSISAVSDVLALNI